MTQDPRIAVLVGIAKRTASAGEPMPTNAELADYFCLQSTSGVVNLLHKAEAACLLRIERFHRERVVTVVETGQSTAAPLNKTPHWRARRTAA